MSSVGTNEGVVLVVVVVAAKQSAVPCRPRVRDRDALTTEKVPLSWTCGPVRVIDAQKLVGSTAEKIVPISALSDSVRAATEDSVSVSNPSTSAPVTFVTTLSPTLNGFFTKAEFEHP